MGVCDVSVGVQKSKHEGVAKEEMACVCRGEGLFWYQQLKQESY